MVQVIPIFLSLVGLVTAFYIYITKKQQKQLICPLGQDCNKVVTSEYSKFLGIPLEFLGMFYFISFALFYSYMYFTGNVNNSLYFFLITLSGTAFVFSLYLILIQRFVIKSWCTLCLFCAGMSISILFLTLLYPIANIQQIILYNENIIKLIYSSGLSLGIGLSLLLDLFLFRFLKDFRISFIENYILNLVFQVLWVVIVLGGGSLIMMYYIIANSGIFVFSAVAFAVIVIFSFILTLVSIPSLIKQSDGRDYNLFTVRKLVKLSLVSGSAALASWYILAVYFYSGYDSNRLLSFVFAYLIILSISIIFSFLIERKMAQSSIVDEDDRS